jgi:hypothetical protein
VSIPPAKRIPVRIIIFWFVTADYEEYATDFVSCNLRVALKYSTGLGKEIQFNVADAWGSNIKALTILLRDTSADI